MTEPLWSLGWDDYTTRTEILVNPKLTTFLVKYDSDEEYERQFDVLQEWMIENDMAYPVPTDDFDALKIEEFLGIRFEGMSSGDIQVECSDSENAAKIREFINTHLDLTAQFCGEVKHGVKHFNLKDVGVCTSYTGLVKSEENELYPYKFFEIREGNKLLAKALVSHFNMEMYECAPTIEVLEVRRPLRGKGIGRKLVRLIEREARREGFSLIWATDADTSYGFWKRLGYKWDLDEAYRYL